MNDDPDGVLFTKGMIEQDIGRTLTDEEYAQFLEEFYTMVHNFIINY